MSWLIPNDLQNRYLSMCRDAVKSDEVFSCFRRNHVYREIVETASKEIGQDNLNIILDRYGSTIVKKWVDMARENDKIGNPTMYSYGEYGLVAPTTLRYLRTASDIIYHLNIQPWWEIAECGIGYGGLYAILSRMAKTEDYLFVDLIEAVELAEKYLPLVNVKIPVQKLPPEHGFDLFISCYAISELSKQIQDEYIKRFVSGARHGYIVYNKTAGSYTLSEFLGKINKPNAVVSPERVTASRSEIIMW